MHISTVLNYLLRHYHKPIEFINSYHFLAIGRQLLLILKENSYLNFNV